MHWPFDYILAISLPVLALFLTCCALLLLRRRGTRQRWQRTGQSVSTPRGYMNYEQAMRQYGREPRG